LAEKLNSQPLPLITEKTGIRLPPEKYCLIAPNYQIDPKATLESLKKKESTLSVKRELDRATLTSPPSETIQTTVDDTLVTMSGFKASLTKAHEEEDYDIMEDAS
jgi:hypothetical protein